MGNISQPLGSQGRDDGDQALSHFSGGDSPLHLLRHRRPNASIRCPVRSIAVPDLMAPWAAIGMFLVIQLAGRRIARAGLRCAPTRSQRQAAAREQEKKNSLVEFQGRPCSTCMKPETVEVLCLLTAPASAESKHNIPEILPR